MCIYTFNQMDLTLYDLPCMRDCCLYFLQVSRQVEGIEIMLVSCLLRVMFHSRGEKKNAWMKEIISPKKWMLHSPPAEKKKKTPWSLECSTDSSGPEGVHNNMTSPRAGLHRPVHGIKISPYIQSVEPTLKEHVERKSKALSCYSKGWRSFFLCSINNGTAWENDVLQFSPRYILIFIFNKP